MWGHNRESEENSTRKSMKKGPKMTEHEALQGEHKHAVEFIWKLQIRIVRNYNQMLTAVHFG